MTKTLEKILEEVFNTFVEEKPKNIKTPEEKEFNIYSSKIKSIEAGSIRTRPSDPVIAFTLDNIGKPVKVILTGEKAKAAWTFLSEGMTMDSTKFVGDIPIYKKVSVNILGAKIKEERSKEIVIKNPKNIEFKFRYLVSME